MACGSFSWHGTAQQKTRVLYENRGFRYFVVLGDTVFWCLRPESNRHALRRLILSQVRLPIPPQRQAGANLSTWHGQLTSPCEAAAYRGAFDKLFTAVLGVRAYDLAYDEE